MVAHRFPVPPVPPDNPPLIRYSLCERLIAAVWQLRIARSPNSPPERTPRADPPGHGEDYECVCARGQEFVVDVIAVNNPPLSCKQGTLFLEELALRHAYPAGIPAMQIERDNRQASSHRERPGERALPSASHAGDDNAVTHQWRHVYLDHGIFVLLFDRPDIGEKVDRSRTVNLPTLRFDPDAGEFAKVTALERGVS